MRRTGYARRLVLVAAITAWVCGCAASAEGRAGPDIATVTYDQSRGPLGDGSGGERPQTDPDRIADVVDLLVRYDTLDTPARPDSTVACVWATITTVRYVTVGGDSHELRASSCDPTPFEADLGALVRGWLAAP